jgi:hypothetical protein
MNVQRPALLEAQALGVHKTAPPPPPPRGGGGPEEEEEEVRRCRVSKPLSLTDALTSGVATCLSRCPPQFVSNECPFCGKACFLRTARSKSCLRGGCARAAIRHRDTQPRPSPSCVSVTYYTWLEQGRDITCADGFVE